MRDILCLIGYNKVIMNKIKNLFSGVLFLALLLSTTALAQPYYIHIQGDSNSEGMLPGPDCKWNDKICAGENTEHPWPSVMQEELEREGHKVIVINHSESGRQLVGHSEYANSENGVGHKDGRAALQQIVMTMMNMGGERNDRQILVINLGTNDLQIKDITEDMLMRRMVTHIATILTNPTLEHRLLTRIGTADRDAAEKFLMTLNRLTAGELATGRFTTELADHVMAHRDLIRRLFDLINWRILIIPPVIVTGHPFGGFPAAHLSPRWPDIVRHVLDFFATPRMTAALEAQAWARPHVDEFGGFVHLNEQDHLQFGLHMATFMARMLPAPQGHTNHGHGDVRDAVGHHQSMFH